MSVRPCQLLFIPCDTVGSNTLLYRGSNTHGSTHSLSHSVGQLLFTLTLWSNPHTLYLTERSDPHSLYLTERSDPHTLYLTERSDPHTLYLTERSDLHTLYLTERSDPHTLYPIERSDPHALYPTPLDSCSSHSRSGRTGLSFNRESNEQKQFLQRPMTHESKDTIPLLFIKRQVLTHNQFSPCSLEAMFFGGLCYLDKINAGCKTTACNESKQTNRRQTGEEEGNT